MMANYVGHRVRFREHSGECSTGKVTRQYEQRLTATKGMQTFEFVKIVQHRDNGNTSVVERKASDVLAVCEVRPKNWRRR